MTASPWAKSLILVTTSLCVIVVTLAFAVLHHDDGDPRIAFALVDQSGKPTTEQDLAGRHLLVFFGFTSCHEICPTQMNKLSVVMTALNQNDIGKRATPVFITIDPERDDTERIAEYLRFFHTDFVGLTGSRIALQQTAKRFKTFLDEVPKQAKADYQLTHSAVVYVVDPNSRIIDYIPFNAGHEIMTRRIQLIFENDQT